MTNRPTLLELTHQAHAERRRLIAPLMGFPGLRLTGGTIKLAQQNYGEHYRAVKSLALRFHPDLIFPLMDLAVEANALGRYTVFPTDDSATVLKAPFSRDELDRLRQINISFDTRLMGYCETLKLMSIGLPSEMLRGAYVIGPYSLAALILGADEAAVATLADTELLTELCELCTEKIQEYIYLLIAAGAQVVGILEPSAVMLGPDQFERFSAQYIGHLTHSCRYAGLATIYHTCGNTMHLVERMAGAGVDALSLDAPAAGVDLAEVARRVGERTVVIGNVSPTGTMLTSGPEKVVEETRGLLRTMDPFPAFVLSTGCDLPQEIPFDNIEAFIETGRAHRVAG